MKESVAIAKEADTKKDILPTKSDNSIHRVRNEPERQLGSLRGVIDSIRSDGGTPSVDSIATQLSSMRTGKRAPVLLALQRTHGNRYVQRVITGIQAKLAVGQPGDIYEQEADRVAEHVMRMPEPEVQRQPEEEEEEELVQPKLVADAEYSIQRQVDEEEEEEEFLQAKELTGHNAEIIPDLESRIQAIRDGGEPLPESERAYFEPRFGYDFSHVRVHTDTRAAESARAVNARAYTVGRDVMFGAGQYAPGTSGGRRLMAHELTHVVQQSDEVPNRPGHGTTRDSRDLRAQRQVEEEELIQTKARSEQITPEEMLRRYSKKFQTDELRIALKKYGIKVSDVLDSSGNITSYKVTSPLLGEVEVKPENLLKELKMLAAAYKITPEPRNYTPPSWLSSEAQEFWNRAVRHEMPKAGGTIKNFGAEITITNGASAEKREDYRTREEIIWVWVTSGRTTQIQAFKYLPTEREAYDSNIKYRASIDYNFSMYCYIEKQKLAPTKAQEKLIVVNMELIRLMILMIGVSGL